VFDGKLTRLVFPSNIHIGTGFAHSRQNKGHAETGGLGGGLPVFR
jgi:hypothetical protein